VGDLVNSHWLLLLLELSSNQIRPFALGYISSVGWAYNWRHVESTVVQVKSNDRENDTTGTHDHDANEIHSCHRK
jgi:hypothetical protein